MKGTVLTLSCFFLLQAAFSQKKPLDHTVYDKWERVGGHLLSPDGKYIVYTVLPQEGDGRLVIRSVDQSWQREVPRGVEPFITGDSRFLIFRIKAPFKDTREARIKKKTPDQLPKDSLGWMELGRDSIVRIPRVKSFRTGEKQGDVLAYLLEKPEGPAPVPTPDSLTRINRLISRADSLAHLADSLRRSVVTIREKGFPAPPAPAKTPAKPAAETVEEGTELVIRDLAGGGEKRIPLVSDYVFSKNGKSLVVRTTKKNNDSTSVALILWVHAAGLKADTIMRKLNDARNFAFDEQGDQLAFVAERDSVSKALVKFYRLWYYAPGMDSAVIRAERSRIPAGKIPHTISPDYANWFSKDGSRLFLGLAPVRPPKDTTLVDFETAKLDIWNYRDDYLAPQQLVELGREQKRSYLAFIANPRSSDKLIPLGDEDCEMVNTAKEGQSAWALGQSTKGYRVQQQWELSDLRRLYLIDMRDGSRKLVQEKIRGEAQLSPDGGYIIWYDYKKRHWITYDIARSTVQTITVGIPVPLWDEEDDHPDDPPPHGLMGWMEKDKYVYVYDRYDIWQCDPAGQVPPVLITRGGRSRKLTYRYLSLDREEQFLRQGQLLLLSVFDRKDMGSGLKLYPLGTAFDDKSAAIQTGPVSLGNNSQIKARNNWTLGYLMGSTDKPYDVYTVSNIDTTRITSLTADNGANTVVRQQSRINPWQSDYNWYTTEICSWRLPDGRMSQGLLYKPENFDSTKKYPIIFYFYERDLENRYLYFAPSPSRSIINVPYFVSNGYLVFDPNIYYKTGQPGEDAYNYVTSAARYMMRKKWVDSTRMGLEGHSWGGYEVSYIVTRSNLFAAAEAGAPVANMTSAYGGIRWGAGISRQFQYERNQSRIGSSPWQRPDLYLKNSPLFHADKVTTPLLMMHNDADGAVPWYQGIEYFTALRRLGKKVWLLQYNGEDHGLKERSNMKDWSMRLSQFFGYYLKGEPAARWITEGVPATLKGIDWGLKPVSGTE